ncbi:RIM9 pH-response regulator protein palI/RIM9 [Candida maltosa Xu316]
MSFKLGFNTVSLLLILVSFVFLLLATISSPIVTTFKLGETSSHTYGIFGYCYENNSKCITEYPMTLSSITNEKSTNWFLQDSSRDTLAKIFILTPISLGFNFLLLVLLVITHFGSKAVLLFAIVINLISLLTAIVSCIVVILAFYPNLAWTGWILIGSAAANLLSMILLIVTLMVFNSSDDGDDVSNLENEDFGRFTNYNRMDDKFNHIQTSTFKTTSLDDDYEYNYKQKTSNNTTATSNTYGNYNHNNNTKDTSLSSIIPASRTNTATSSGVGSGVGVGGSVPVAGAAGAVSSSNYGQPSRVLPPGQRHVTSHSLTSNSSSYYTKPQTANDFTQRNNSYGYQNQQPQNQSQPQGEEGKSEVPYPTRESANYSSSVFETNDAKPFIELDDFDDVDDDNEVEQDLKNTNTNGGGLNDSDDDSDFTSVSQRAPNPNYYNNNQGYYANHYTNVQHYTPQHNQQQQQPQRYPQNYNQQPYRPQFNPAYSSVGSQASAGGAGYYPNQPGPRYPNQPGPQQQRYFQQQQQQQQQQRPTISDNVLNLNPDLSFKAATTRNKKMYR